ncbi:MAG: outer membrane beta-barrel protein [Bradyrhizobium sp.]|nr:outer membrane beta-barrel protein [Bradyrhizobium sp.]
MHRLLVAASLLLPAAALAQDIPHRVRPETVPDSWAAPYIGAYYAVAAGGRSSELADEANISSSQTSLMKGDFSGPVTGSMVELFAGRNWRFGNFIVGGQVEATVASDIAASVTGPLQLNQVRRFGGVILSSWSGPTTNGNDPQLRFRAGLVGRAGFLVRPNLLLYGLAGLEFGHFIFPDDDDAFGSANRNWALGYTAGAGLEARYDDHWSLRAEYRYLHFATARSEVRDIGTYLSSIRHLEVDMHVGKVGLVYSFGGSGPSSAMAAIPPLSRQVWADSWAGPYAGIYFGAGAGHAAENYSSVRNLTNIWGADTTTTNQTKRGQFAGGMDGSMNEVFLGYNWRSGRAVAGVQAEGTLFSDVGLKPVGALTTTVSSATNGVADPTTLDVRPGWNNQQLRSMVGLAGRAGFLATPDLLLYGVGGVEFGHFVYPRGRDAIGGNNGKWAPGYTAGAGAELRMTDHWSLRGEYRYLHFDVDRNETIGSASVEAISGDTSEATTNTARQTAADFHIGKIGVVYKFGGAGPASAMAAMPPSLASTWTDGWAGPYFGAYFSAGAGVARGDFATISTSSSVTFPQNGALAGTMTGMQTDLFAGYSLRSDRFVVGGQVEATQYGDVAVKMAGMQTTLLPPTSVQTSTLDQSERLRSMVSVVGRAGFLATPNLLLYGLGGLALGHFKYPEQGDRFPDPVGKWVAGYTVGAGGELKVARHWSLRTEYRYLHFDIERGASYDIFPAAGGSTAVSFASRTSTDFHLGKVGLVYRVGEDSPSAMAALPGSAEACCDRWTGFSAGIYGAGGAGRVRDAITSSSDNRTLFPPPVILSGSNDFQSGELAGDVSGGMIDLFAGYNWRAGQFVIGGQVEATVFGDVGMKSRGTLVGTSTSLVPPLTTVSTTDQSEFAQLLRSRAGLIGRIGLLATPNLLVYALAGAEFGHFTFQDTVDQLGGAYGKWAFGYTAGAGAELKLTDRWSVRGEYRLMRFNLDREAANVFTHTDVGFAILSANSSTAHTRTDLHLGKVGVAYTFCYCD